MRVTNGGVYVMVEKYGLEGLLVLENGQKLEAKPEKDEATIFGPGVQVVVKTFDRINVQITAEMVEFRRSVNLVFRSAKQ